MGIKKQFLSLNTLASLLGAEAMLLLTSAHAVTPPEVPIRIGQLQPWSQTYSCGKFAITLSQEGEGDRYTYKAVNAKGQTLTITDGTQSGGRNYSSIYTFNRSDGTEFVLEDYGGGKAALSIGNYPDQGVTYDCTTDGT